MNNHITNPVQHFAGHGHTWPEYENINPATGTGDGMGGGYSPTPWTDYKDVGPTAGGTGTTVNPIDNPDTTTRNRPGSTEEGGSTSTGSSTSSSTARAREAIVESYYDEIMAKAEMLRGWYKECCMYFAENYVKPPAPIVRREIATIIKNGMTAECLKAIMDESQNAPRPSWGYAKAIVRRCEAAGVKTLAEWIADKRKREAARNPALNYQQREYSEEDFGADFFFDADSYAPSSPSQAETSEHVPMDAYRVGTPEWCARHPYEAKRYGLDEHGNRIGGGGA